MVGQSGVGKSSLLRALVPDSDAAIGTLVRDRCDGRHTTTASWLYALPQGGALIDSPGVRDFAPAIDRLHDADLGFTEIAALSAHCRFGDCRHMREPDCAVRAAAGARAMRVSACAAMRATAAAAPPLSERLRQPSG
jgi:ribosome biogenesis GTPase